jgi:hypothetical protein
MPLFLASSYWEKDVTAVVIALAVVAWLVVVLLCLGLARSAAMEDAMLLSRRKRRPRRRDREAA